MMRPFRKLFQVNQEIHQPRSVGNIQFFAQTVACGFHSADG